MALLAQSRLDPSQAIHHQGQRTRPGIVQGRLERAPYVDRGFAHMMQITHQLTTAHMRQQHVRDHVAQSIDLLRSDAHRHLSPHGRRSRDNGQGRRSGRGHACDGELAGFRRGQQSLYFVGKSGRIGRPVAGFTLRQQPADEIQPPQDQIPGALVRALRPIAHQLHEALDKVHQARHLKETGQAGFALQGVTFAQEPSRVDALGFKVDPRQIEAAQPFGRHATKALPLPLPAGLQIAGAHATYFHRT